MASNLKTRDYLFDNYKTLLIFLVVVGHFIEPCCTNNLFLSSLKWVIVSFHMPAFIFISGYFSKRKLSIKELIRKLAVPYIVYEIVYFLFYKFMIHKETGLYLLYPKFSLWYILALMVWRMITPYVKKLPHHMILSILAGLLIGCSDMPGNFLSIPRILVFYPFFLAGIHFDRSIINKYRNKATQFIAATFTFACMAFVAFGPFANKYSTKIFYGRYNYAFLGQTPVEGILCRTICYVIGFILTFSLMFLVSEKQTSYSYIGVRTMAIYLFHGLTYNYLKDRTDFLENVDTLGESIGLILCCVLITGIFSISPLTTITNMVSNLHLPKIPNQIPIPTYLYYPASQFGT